jgi:hypothetical protein
LSAAINPGADAAAPSISIPSTCRKQADVEAEEGTDMAQHIAYVVVGVAFVAFVISRQIRLRRVTVRGLAILPAWFVGIATVSDHTLLHRLTASGVAGGFFLAGVLLAAVMGLARSTTLRVWKTAEGTFCQGGWRTGALWVLTIALRVGMFLVAAKAGAREGGGEAMLYVAVTLGVQNLMIARRAGLLGSGRVGADALGSGSLAAAPAVAQPVVEHA